MIRCADDDDAHALYLMEKAASRTALAHVFGDIAFPDNDVLARWRLVLQDPSATVLVDELDDEPIGYAAYGDGWLRHFGVVPAHWRTGRAQSLHAAVLEGSSVGGAPASYLWVLEDNHRARAFYRRLGWRDTDMREQETFAPFPFKTQMTRSPYDDRKGSSAWTSP